MVEHHLANIAIAITAMIPSRSSRRRQYLRLFAPIAYVIGVLLLVVVEVTVMSARVAQRCSTSASCASNLPRS